MQPKKYVYYDGNHKPSDFETVAAAADVALNSIGDTIGDVGLSFLGKSVSAGNKIRFLGFGIFPIIISDT